MYYYCNLNYVQGILPPLFFELFSDKIVEPMDWIETSDLMRSLFERGVVQSMVFEN